MIIIGIDPGTARMGYSIIQVDADFVPKVVETNVLITAPEIEMHHRLRQIYKGLRDISKKHSPDVMVIEKLFFNTNVKTAITVGQARGVAMLAAADSKMNLFEYTALQAKVLLTGYGRSTKKEMQEAVKENLKLDSCIKSDDANDAIAIALCFIKKDMAQYLKNR